MMMFYFFTFFKKNKIKNIERRRNQEVPLADSPTEKKSVIDRERRVFFRPLFFDRPKLCEAKKKKEKKERVTKGSVIRPTLFSLTIHQ